MVTPANKAILFLEKRIRLMFRIPGRGGREMIIGILGNDDAFADGKIRCDCNFGDFVC